MALVTYGMVLPLALLAFCTWAVYLGGLAAMQNSCMEDPYFSQASLESSRVACREGYRYWWFIMAFEFVIILGLILAALMNKLRGLRLAFLGLFAVATLLFIQASEYFLNRQSLGLYPGGQLLHRIRTITAGAIMTATVNALLIIALGLTEVEPHRGTEAALPAHTAEKPGPAPTVTVA